jgi:enoyl-CoA hydratase
MTYENINLETNAEIAVITINRPAALNALNAKVIDELWKAITSLTSVRAAILTGAGEKAFVAGADIAEMAGMDAAAARSFSNAGHVLMRSIEDRAIPIIAAVNGFALGGGCELALACDFIYASSRAQFGQPEVALGVIPGFGGTARLARRVGLARARELIYTGKRIGAEEALRIGLVNAVFEPGELIGAARKTAAEIAMKGPLAIAQAKRVLAVDPEEIALTAFDYETEGFAELFDTADQKEGMKAFLEKRKPQWTSS